jgi:hypothetical protein
MNDVSFAKSPRWLQISYTVIAWLTVYRQWSYATALGLLACIGLVLFGTNILFIPVACLVGYLWGKLTKVKIDLLEAYAIKDSLAEMLEESREESNQLRKQLPPVQGPPRPWIC